MSTYYVTLVTRNPGAGGRTPRRADLRERILRHYRGVYRVRKEIGVATIFLDTDNSLSTATGPCGAAVANTSRSFVY